MWPEWETGEAHTGIWWRDLRKRDHLQYLGVDGRILKKIFKKWNVGGMDWIDLTRDSDRWRAVLNATMNLPVSIKCGEFLD